MAFEPLSAKHIAEATAAGLDPNLFHYNTDTQLPEPIAQSQPSGMNGAVAAFLEPLARTPGDVSSGFNRGVSDIAGMLPEPLQRALLTSQLPGMAIGAMTRRGLQPTVDELASVPRQGGMIEGGAGIAGNVLASVAPLLAGPAGVPLMAELAATKRYGNIRDQGGGIIPASLGAGVDAVASALPLGALKGLSTGGAALKAGGIGAATGAGSQVAQNVIAKGSYNTETPLLEGVGGATALGGAFGAGGGALVSRMSRIKPAEPLLNMAGSDNVSAASAKAPDANTPPQMQQFPNDASALRRELKAGIEDPAARAQAIAQLREIGGYSEEAVTQLLPYGQRVGNPALWFDAITKAPDQVLAVGDPVAKAFAKAVKNGFALSQDEVARVLNARDPITALEQLKTSRGAEVALGKRANEVAAAKEQAQMDLDNRTQQAAAKLAAERDAAAATAVAERQKAEATIEQGTEKLRQQMAADADKQSAIMAQARKDHEALIAKNNEKLNQQLAAERDAIEALKVQARDAGVDIPEMLKTSGEMSAYMKERLRLLSELNNPPEAPAGAVPVETVQALQKSAETGVTVPETPATVAAQSALTANPNSSKAATLVTKGEVKPPVQAPLVEAPVAEGTLIVNPNKVDPAVAVEAANAGKVGKVLGMSQEAKPTGGDTSVTARTSDGTVVQDEVVTKEQVPTAVEAAKKLTPDVIVEVKPFEEVINERVGARPKRTSSIGEAEPTPPAMDPAAAEAAQLQKFEEYMAQRRKAKGSSIAPPKEEVVPVVETTVSPKAEPTPVKRAKKSSIKEAPVEPLTDGERGELGVLESADETGMLNEKQSKRLAELQAKRAQSEKTGEPATSGGSSVDKSAGKGGIGSGFKLNPRKQGEAGFVNVPGADEVADRVARTLRATRNLIASPVARLQQLPGKYAKYAANKLQQLPEAREKYNYEAQDILYRGVKGIPAKDIEVAGQYRADMDRDGISPIQLTPNQQRAVDAMNTLAFHTRAIQNTEGPYIREGSAYRPGEYREYYQPQTLKDDIWKKLKSGDKATKDKLISHLVNEEGYTINEAESVYQKMSDEKPTILDDSVDFGPLRRPEGVRYPREWLTNPVESWLTYLNKWSADMAMSKAIEQDPVMANLRGNLEDSRGGMHPDNISVRDEPEVAQIVQRGLKSFAASISPRLDIVDKATSLATGGMVQHGSAIPDVLMSLPSTWAQTDIVNTAKALAKTLTPGSFEEARGKGYIPSFNRSNPELGTQYATSRIMDIPLRMLDKYRTATGLHAAQDFTRLMGSFAGELSAKDALANKNTKFFDRLDIKDPFTRPADEVVAEAANRVQKNVTSSYDIRDIPEWLTTGSGNQGARAILGLSRFAIGQTNRQLAYMGRALRQGDISPMLKMATGGLLTAAAANEIKERLFKKKPSDMTWSEWMNLDQPEPLRYAVNQAAAANLGGFITQVTAQMANYGTGVKAYGPRSQAGQLLDSMGEHLGWLMEKIDDGGLEGKDVPKLLNSFARDVMQDYRLLTEGNTPDNNRREVGMYNRIEKGERGKAVAQRANPIGANAKWRDLDTVDEVLDNSSEIFMRALEGKPVPATPNAFEEPGFYDFLGKMKGPDEADKAYQRDKDKQLGVNRFKNKIESIANRVRPKELKYDKQGKLIVR